MLPWHHPDTPTSFSSSTTSGQDHQNLDPHTTFHDMFPDEFDVDSDCSTPYVSAPSSPSRTTTPLTGFYYSAPSSPMHFILSTAAVELTENPSVSPHSEASPASSTCSFEFDFSARLTTNANGTSSTGSMTMTSADELFFNGQIRPMKRSDVINYVPFDADEIGVGNDRGRAVKYRDRSRRTRSMSPLRTIPFEWQDDFEVGKNEEKEKMESEVKGDDGDVGNGSEGLDLTTTPIPCDESGSSSRSSSVGRSSRRWVFLKEFLYRSKSEGRNNGNKFWGSLSFSPVKDKIKMEKFLPTKVQSNNTVSSKEKISGASMSLESAAAGAEAMSSSSCSEAKKGSGAAKEVEKKKTVKGVGKRRVPPSPHELHYTANRAQAGEMRKKTFLPYRQGLIGCLGFSSKSYGAMNGFARALNPVSSR